jgi:hypothetical protein
MIFLRAFDGGFDLVPDKFKSRFLVAVDQYPLYRDYIVLGKSDNNIPFHGTILSG